ncbi:hypothetical protein GMSM_19120 [Geomonas sp. Red276]
MSDDGSRNRILPFSGLILALAALSVMFFTRTPFQETRPEAPQLFDANPEIEARLWEDPFLAVLRGRESPQRAPERPEGTVGGEPPLTFDIDVEGAQNGAQKEPQTGEVKGLLAEAWTRANKEKTQPDAKHLRVVAMMVFGTPYAEDEERRVRDRYAALSAFRRLGFVPRNLDKIGYISVKGKNISEKGLRSIMPFEWLRHVRDEDENILLLWLNDDLFTGQPLAKLEKLAASLGSNVGTPDGHPLKVIGPAGATNLKSMAAEAKGRLDRPSAPQPYGTCSSARNKESQKGPPKEPTKEPAKIELTAAATLEHNIEIYSATATYDDPVLLSVLRSRTVNKEAGVTEEFSLAKTKFRFRRTICTDRELAGKIFDELTLRGIDCRNRKDHIVLVSECDTEYGRAMADAYRDVFFGRGVINIKEQLHTFSYLRGIDGKGVPRKAEEGGSGEKSAADKGEEGTGDKKSTSATRLEKASGLSQFDYMRRLAEQVYQFEQQLENGGTIRAIGVLGSDFHDKYLVIQAMRQRFPQAVLFTSDLDARFLQPDAVRITRNLVVASTFPLSLRNDPNINLQGDVPPFRDSYQTSEFFAILHAFANDGYLEPSLREVMHQQPHPKVFEIGRYRAVDLSEDPANTKSFYPRHREADSSGKLLGKIVVTGLLTLALLLLSSERLRQFFACGLGSRRTRAAMVIFISLNASVVLLFYRLILMNPHKEEPLSFVEGVSVWPTEVIRGCAVALALFFLWRRHVQVAANRRSIHREFRFNSREKGGPPGASGGDDEDGAERRRGRLATGDEHRPPTVSPRAERGCAGNRKDGGDTNRRKRKRGDRTGVVGDVRGMFRKFADIARYDWDISQPARGATMDSYWCEYCRRDSINYRVRRLAPIVVCYLALCGLIVSLSMPVSPVRGIISMGVDRIMLGAMVLSFTLLVFCVFDVIRTCRRFIDLVAERAPRWGGLSFRHVLKFPPEKSKAVWTHWMLVYLVARRTETVGRCIFYPFIVWLLILFSRFDLFDNWKTPIALAVVMSLSAVYTWSCAWLLRRSAEKVRKISLDRLGSLLAAALARQDQSEAEVSRIRFVIERVAAIRDGAFAPFTQNPVVQALLVPMGGVGVYALDILAKLKI